MGVTKLKHHIKISLLAAFSVFVVVLIQYDQNQLDSNQEKRPSQNIEVRQICNVNKVSVNIYFSVVLISH